MPPAPSRALFVLKLAHTLIWLFFALLVCYIPMAAAADAVTPFTWVAAGLVALEGLTLLIFSWHCPLTLLGKRLTHRHTEGFDIYLPGWVARHNKAIFTTIYVLGLALLMWRALA